MGKACALLLLGTCLALAQDAVQIVGRWRSEQTSKGGIGAMYDFAADGTVHFSPGAIVPTQYRLEGDRLTLDPSDGIGYTLTWNGDDRLRLAVSGSGSEDCSRLGARRDPLNKLVGEWTGTRDMDGNKVVTHWIFGPDSKALFMIRFLTHHGNYTIQNGRLVAKFGEQIGLDGTISLAGDILTINRSAGRVTRLLRY